MRDARRRTERLHREMAPSDPISCVSSNDLSIRDAAIKHCRLLAAQWGEAVPASELKKGFPFQGAWIKLMGPQGVFKPKEISDGALTLLSTLASRYEDEEMSGDVMLYDYAPPQRDYENTGLKRLAAAGRSVIVLKQVNENPSEYMIWAPVAIMGMDDVARKVKLNLAAANADVPAAEAAPIPAAFSRAYAETIVKARLHQAHFRKATLRAYRSRCCVCALNEHKLLDAAHIVDDRLPEGLAQVRNGMSMCPTHHRAYDRGVLLVHEDYRTEVRRDRLNAADSNETRAMLLDFAGREINRPKDEAHWPDPALLRLKLELVA